MNFVHANALGKLRAEHNLSESNMSIQNLEHEIDNLEVNINILRNRIIRDCAISMIFVVGIAATCVAYLNNRAE